MGIVNNVRVYDLEETLAAAGYPMKTGVLEYGDVEEKDIKRAKNLIKALINDNQAHGQFLTGIVVNFDLTFSVKAWTEAERYRFLSFISSESTMHRITKFNLDESYSPYTDIFMVERMKELVEEYNKNQTPENYLKVLYSNPCGFKLTARLTTNYRCLRNIYKQRKNHRLPEWKEFCQWIETLPYSWLITWDGSEEISE